jgi:putative FmdB family regulatory protein
MPIYEYRCRGCNRQFEALVRPDTIVTCPSCESRDLELQISLFAVSSAATRQSALAVARRDGAKRQRDEAIAEEKRLHHHDH